MRLIAANGTTKHADRQVYDLVVIGGGVNRVWIVREAAGRGLSVLLCERRMTLQARPRRQAASRFMADCGLSIDEQGEATL